MGLGKTVQMIATMAVNQPKADDPQTTLVVVPAALLQQVRSCLVSSNLLNLVVKLNF